MALSIEAGRRCDSGPGIFNFETQQAERIFLLIQSTIKRWKTSTVSLGVQSQEGEKVVVTNIRAHSPLPRTPDDANMAAILNKHRLALEEGAQAQTEPATSPQPAPITLMPLPMVPTHEGASGRRHAGQSDAIYADPDDCVQPLKQQITALYVDPASVLPLKPPCSREAAPSAAPPPPGSHVVDSVYSEVYDKVKQPDLQSKRKTDDEPIYAEPMSETLKAPQSEKKPDPFAHLYAQVCKTPPLGSSSSSSSSPKTTASSASSLSCVTATVKTTQTTDESLGDVIYENLGII